MIYEHEFRFCPKCGGELERNGENLLVCRKCNLHYYINPKPTNAVILVNTKGEILLTKRKYEPKKDYWDLPGGFVNMGETIEDSVMRELKEELDIEISHFTYFASEHDLYPFKGINYFTICSVFTCSFDELQKIVPADDVSEVKWFALDEIDYEQIAFEGLKKVLNKFAETSSS